MPEPHVDKWKTELRNKPLRRMIGWIIPAPHEKKDDDDEGIRHFELQFLIERRPEWGICYSGQLGERASGDRGSSPAEFYPTFYIFFLAAPLSPKLARLRRSQLWPIYLRQTEYYFDSGFLCCRSNASLKSCV